MAFAVLLKGFVGEVNLNTYRQGNTPKVVLFTCTYCIVALTFLKDGSQTHGNGSITHVSWILGVLICNDGESLKLGHIWSNISQNRWRANALGGLGAGSLEALLKFGKASAISIPLTP